MKRILGAALLAVAAACARKSQTPTVQTALATRRDIIVDAQANGTMEPIAIIDVKSKASGVIDKMTVETGTNVKPGDLIVQINTRDVQNRYDQAKAMLDAAQAKLQVSEANKTRNEAMFKARVITPQEFEQVAVDYENAKSGVVNAQANLDLAKQSLEDATVKAPSEGTIITKNVSEGTVIAGATNSVSGGTTIVQMADLEHRRIRAFFNESDIGNVHPGEPANVTVDAYPDRRFSGVVQKIEPQAVVQQNVTMFPVLVNLENHDGLLRPGMNGEVSVLIDEVDNVVAVPNDAIKNPREAVATGAMLGLNADSVQASLRAQGFTGGGNRGGFGGRAAGTAPAAVVTAARRVVEVRRVALRLRTARPTALRRPPAPRSVTSRWPASPRRDPATAPPRAGRPVRHAGLGHRLQEDRRRPQGASEREEAARRSARPRCRRSVRPTSATTERTEIAASAAAPAATRPAGHVRAATVAAAVPIHPASAVVAAMVVMVVAPTAEAAMVAASAARPRCRRSTTRCARFTQRSRSTLVRPARVLAVRLAQRGNRRAAALRGRRVRRLDRARSRRPRSTRRDRLAHAPAWCSSRTAPRRTSLRASCNSARATSTTLKCRAVSRKVSGS